MEGVDDKEEEELSDDEDGKADAAGDRSQIDSSYDPEWQSMIVKPPRKVGNSMCKLCNQVLFDDTMVKPHKKVMRKTLEQMPCSDI